MRLVHSFEYGSNGNLIAVLDGGYGATRFDSITANGSVAPVYSTAQVHNGTLSCKSDAGAGAVGNYVEWINKVGSQTRIYGRGYYYFSANPGGNTDLVRILATAGTNQLIAQISSTGKVRLASSSATAVASTNSISLGSWFRLEYDCIAGATATQTIKLFNSPESTTPTETITLAAVSGATALNKIRCGQVSGIANAAYWMDDLEFNTTGYPGPLSTGTPPVTTWYVSKNGDNSDGLSWATAWNELDQIDFALIAPGDTVLIDGGPNRYVSSDDFGYDFINHATNRPGINNNGMLYTTPFIVGGSGQSSKPITFTTSDDAGHDGTVVVFGGRSTLLPEANSTGYGTGPQGRQIGIDLRGVSYVDIKPKHRSQMMVYGCGIGAADTSVLGSTGCGLDFNSTSHDITIRNLEIFDCGNYGQWNRPSDNALVSKTDQEGITLFAGDNIVIERCLIHDNGQDSIQGGPANGLVLRHSWLYYRRAHSTWTGYAFNAGSQAVPDQNTTHTDGIQLYNGGIGNGPLTVDTCIAGPMVNQGFYFGDGNLTSFDNVYIKNCITLLCFRHGIQGDVGSGGSPANWLIEKCTVHMPSTYFPGYSTTPSAIEVEGGGGHRVIKTIMTWGADFYQNSNWDTANCNNNFTAGGGSGMPGGTVRDPLFVNAISPTNNTPTFAQAMALDLTPQDSVVLSAGAGADIHSVRDLLDLIDTLNGDLAPSDEGGDTTTEDIWIAPPGSVPPSEPYRVLITNIDGSIRDEIPVKNLQYTWSLNDAGSVSFSMPIYHAKTTPDNLKVGARNILIYRYGDLIWGGRLWTAGTDAETAEINFGGNGWFSLLMKRYVDATLNYVSQDQFDIAWGLINRAQFNGDLGITRASTAGSGILRTRHYYGYECKNIGEALQELAAVNNGFDFEITPDLQWKTYYPDKGKALTDVVFELGKNIRGYSIQYDATNIANEITGIGAGDGRAALRSTKSNAASKATYGLMQETRSWADVKRQSTLDDHTQEEVRLSKNPIVRPEFSLVTDDPPFGAYSIGDVVPVHINDGYNQLNQAFRISTITVSVANSGFEAIGIFFDDQLE